MILGLDPGRDKVGFALVSMDRALLLSGIFSSVEEEAFWAAVETGQTEAFAPWLRERVEPSPEWFRLLRVAVGNGTCGDRLKTEAERHVECAVVETDERGTTLEARELYWQLHRPAWWQRLLPGSLRVPPRVLDDLAAWAIALRVFDV